MKNPKTLIIFTALLTAGFTLASAQLMKDIVDVQSSLKDGGKLFLDSTPARIDIYKSSLEKTHEDLKNCRDIIDANRKSFEETYRNVEKSVIQSNRILDDLERKTNEVEMLRADMVSLQNSHREEIAQYKEKIRELQSANINWYDLFIQRKDKELQE